MGDHDEEEEKECREEALMNPLVESP